MLYWNQQCLVVTQCIATRVYYTASPDARVPLMPDAISNQMAVCSFSVVFSNIHADDTLVLCFLQLLAGEDQLYTIESNPEGGLVIHSYI